MSHSYSKKTGLGLAVIALSGGIGLASSSAFAVQALPQGYELAAADKTSEGKCGEGKCGSSEAGAAAPKVAAAEGKCGEGKCGDAIFNSIDTNHDAKVSLAEFLIVAPNQQAAFAKKDTNKDGYIDEMESYISVKAAYNEHGKDLPTGLFSTKE